MASTYEPIATTTLTSGSSTITFSSIPATYTDLVVVCVLNELNFSKDPQPALRFNGDTSSNYSDVSIRGTSTTIANAQNTSVGYINMSEGATVNDNGSISIAHVMSYRSTSFYKTVIGGFGNPSSAAGSAIKYSGTWRSTSAINSVTVFDCNGFTFAFGVGSTVTIYGIKAA